MAYILTDGSNTKALNPWDVDANPEAWTWLSNAPQRELDDMFYRVAASFRAVNKRSVAAANVPFQILKGETVVNDSTSWDAKATPFLTKPKDLIKRVSLSLTFQNKAYLLRGKNIGDVTKALHFLIPTTIQEIVNTQTGEIDHFERNVNGRVIKYAPDSKDLIKIWLLDHTTELLPSRHTAVNAIFNSTGSIYFADLFIRNFYERGGIKPTVLALKGAIFNEKKEDIERGWSRFLRNLSRFSSKIFNADTMDVKPIGAGVDDLKNNEVYRQAIENIALGIGMPTSHLLSDWDSYATATVDYMMWQRDDIFPLCEAIAEDLNLQVFTPMGLRFDFQTEMSDAETQDEVDRAKAYEIYVGAGIKPSIAAQMVGIELPDGVEYDALDKMAEENEAKEQAKAEADRAAQMEMVEAKKPAPGEKPIKSTSTSAMIALRIPDAIRAEIKAKYSFVDNETLNNLHITLVYLGDNRTIDKLAVVRAVNELGQYQAPIKGKLQGLARFMNGQDVDPLVMTFDSPQAPGLYNMLCGLLDNYHVPFHKDHGFIPHMTLAYIPADAEMPIDGIEPIEINFSDVYFVDGSVWYPVQLTGYDNKTKSAKWSPSLDELNELRVWQKAAIQKHKRGEPLDFEYLPHYGGLPDDLTDSIRTALLVATTADEIKAAFEIDIEPTTQTPAPAYRTDPGLLALAASLNSLTEAYMKALSVTPAPVAQTPNVNITMSPIQLTAQMPEAGQPSVIVNIPEQPAPIVENVVNVPAPVVNNEVTVKPATVKVDMPKPKKEKQKIKRDGATGLIQSTETEIEY
jgi:2'-5' RNA ligase